MANMQVLLSAAFQFMLIWLSLLSPGQPNYAYTGTKQDIDPIVVALTTSHDIVVRHFGLEKLHSFLVPGRCQDTDYRCRKESCSRSTIRAASRSSFMLFLLLSGDVSLNPGPRNWKYPCSVCHKPVTKNQDGLQCDQCDIWTHLKCLPDAIHITKDQYVTLSNTDTNWYCYGCQLPIFSDSFFSSRSDTDDDDSDTDHIDYFAEIRNRHPKDLFVAYLNINSYRHKVVDMRDNLKETPVDILGIAETKLDDSFPNAQFSIDGYRTFRKDRNQHGGGLFVYVRSDIPCRQIKTLEWTNIESIVLELHVNKTKYLIVTTYKPPNVHNNTFTLEMTDFMDIATRDLSNIWVIGDLNFDLRDRVKGEPLRDMCDVYGLKQLINEPTNMTRHGPSLIDVVLATKATLSSSSGSVNTGLSDTHNMVYTTLKVRAPRLPSKAITYRDYKCFQEDLYIEDVNRIPVTACQIFDDPTDNYWALQTLLTEVINQHAPLKTVRVKATEVPFMNRKLKRAVRDKMRLFNAYRKHSIPHNWEKYRLQRILTVTIRRDAIRSYFNNKCSTGAKNTDLWPTKNNHRCQPGQRTHEQLLCQCRFYDWRKH